MDKEPELAGGRKVRDQENVGGAPQDGTEQAANLSGSPGSSPENAKTGQQGFENEDEKPKRPKLKQLWDKLGLDAGTVMMMFK